MWSPLCHTRQGVTTLFPSITSLTIVYNYMVIMIIMSSILLSII